MKERKITFFPTLYILWLVFVLVVIFSNGGLNNDNITHIIILLVLFFSIFLFKDLKPKNPKYFFILSCVFLASLAEGAYMISKPVLDSLLVKRGDSAGVFIHNYLVDLSLTIPAYFLIFFVIWKLVNKYEYSTWGYIFFFSLGQALGDGNAFFIANPTMLIFIPYIMINYHAMNIAPFLTIKDYLDNQNRSKSNWKYPIAIISIFTSYIVGGTLIKLMVKFIGLE